MLARQAGGQACAVGLPPSLTSFSGPLPSPCGDPGPLPWAPSGREAHTERFPMNCSKELGLLPLPPSAGEGVCRSRGSDWGNQPVLYQPDSDPDRCFVLF